jgi:hypothetical protein
MPQVQTCGKGQLLGFTQFDTFCEYIATTSFDTAQDTAVECHHGGGTVTTLFWNS